MRLAAVVGVPDPERTEIVKAFVVLQDGWKPSEELTHEIQEHVKVRLAALTSIRARSAMSMALPLTSTGKIIRKALREGLGEDGDNPTAKR